MGKICVARCGRLMVPATIKYYGSKLGSADVD